ncbi:hypothetical protein [Burkholderia multivorans]|uniref:hypothetical protein n=1 Tax=Burkholderia multivorans TaxID=87883 RepID=UPI00138A2EF1|nr:hypothetical protein [Burkholderia multivorans]MBJ9654352.1 hypothetical protein [Burkholderia multivorans]MBR8047380.1 hypothetical protein [Burkholderia multivorans]MBR8122522.1 hypothetical protein [Burkholderia multivorans]MBU9165081.1 hypothetical protein [Burkholderia multivorans]MBU9451797.1 hypothetical protein [Burkholderia multivorans]
MLTDVRDEYVSVAGAARDYGVVVTAAVHADLGISGTTVAATIAHTSVSRAVSRSPDSATCHSISARSVNRPGRRRARNQRVFAGMSADGPDAGTRRRRSCVGTRAMLWR